MKDAQATLAAEDVALLSRFLLWRVAQAGPVDPSTEKDVDCRLRLAGEAFRLHTRPLSPDELVQVADRLSARRS